MSALLGKHRLGALLFIIGLFLSLGLSSVALMADLEVDFYEFRTMYGQRVQMDCPVFVTPAQPGRIRVSVRNPGAYTARQTVDMEFSSPTVVERGRQVLELAPESQAEMVWEVDQRNVDMGFYILAHAVILPAGGLRLREANCGMIYLNIPWLDGDQTLTLALSIGLATLLGGVYLWEKGHPAPGKRSNSTLSAMRTLGALTLIGLLAGMQGSTLIAIMALVASVLGVVVFLLYLLILD